MNPLPDLAIFLLGSLTGGTAVAIIAASMFSRKIDKHARGLYMDGFNNGVEAARETEEAEK